MPVVVIGPERLRRRPGRFRNLLETAGFTPLDPPGDRRLSEDELLAILPEADALIAGAESLTARAIERASKLRAIVRTGVGHERIDLAAATAHGIPVAITPGANHESVAEQTLALLFALSRNVIANDRSIRSGRWERSIPRPLRGSTLGVVGFGRIGRAVAVRALALGMRVVACRRDPAPVVDADCAIDFMPLDDLLAECDVVSLHLPLTDATRGLFDRQAFARMRAGAFFINTARGGLVVEQELADALRSGRLAGAGLDVLCSEPPAPENPLLALPNVVLSPHLGASDSAAVDNAAEMAARCLVTLHRGGWPEGCVLNDDLRCGWRWDLPDREQAQPALGRIDNQNGWPL